MRVLLNAVSYVDPLLTDLNGKVLTDASMIYKGSLLYMDGQIVRAVEDRIGRYEALKVSPPGTVYLAGPMRGRALHNFPAFLTADAYLKSQGFDVVNPAKHDLDAGFDMTKKLEDQKSFSLEKALGWDFVQVVKCDGIVLLPGWDTSVGAKAERLVAEMTGKFVLHLSEEMKLSYENGWASSLTWARNGR